MPQALGYQQMRVGRAGAESTLSNALSEHRAFALTLPQATAIAAEVAGGVDGWQAHFERCGVSPHDYRLLAQQVRQAVSLGAAPFLKARLLENPTMQVSPSVNFRALTPADQPALWHWLHIALWDPPPAPPRPLDVLQHLSVRVYAEAWGHASDVGVVAGEDAGACWMRLLPPQVGLAYVDEATPQLGIALEPQFQRQGYGKPLMLRALGAAAAAGYQQVALTVHPENGARLMYQQCGFELVALRGGYHLMIARLA